MKTLMSTLAILFFGVFSCFAQSAEERSKNLSDKMIRELQLNNYQSRKIREINLKNAQRMMAFEAQHANNPSELEKCINGVCKERDQQLENLLSTAQYSQYYSFRKTLNSYDREYAMKQRRQDSKVASTLVAQDKTDAKRSFPAPKAAVIKEASLKN